MRDVAKVLMAAAIGTAIGGAVVSSWSVSDVAPMAPGASAPRDAARPSAPASAASATQGERRAIAPPADETATADRDRAEGSLFTDRLRAFATAEIARGWRELRTDDVPADIVERGLRDYEDLLRTRAHWFGRSVAEQRNEAERKTSLLASDDLVAMLAGIGGDEPEAKALVASDRFASLFAPRGGGSAVDGTTLARDGKVADGSVVAFPAGVFAVQDFARGNDPYPVDLTVRGAGMDATLLVVDEQNPRGPVHRLAIEDCTVFAGGLMDARTGPAVVSLTRVRLIGFDTGAGGSCGLYVEQTALRAVGCRFESGYGANPGGYANLLRSSKARLVRFERSSFERVSLANANTDTVRFIDCTLVDMLDAQPAQPTFRNCRYTTIAEEKRWDADYRRRDLNALFPQWKERLQGR